MFVEFPGYSDYRHVPVIGKGITFQMPDSPDIWGMMCEADLEEVYRMRSIGFQLGTTFAASILLGIIIYQLLSIIDFTPQWLALILTIVYGIIATSYFYKKQLLPIIKQWSKSIKFMRHY